MTTDTTASVLYGPHCDHADLCSMFGCDQRGHIDYPCRRQASCSYCHPAKPCPMNAALSVADCPDCRVQRDDVSTPEPAEGGAVVVAEQLAHAKDCYAGDQCVECGGCDCGVIESACAGGCWSFDERDEWRAENGYDEESYV